MIENIVLGFLAASLDVPVYLTEPAHPPTSYVRIERTGGSKQDHIKMAAVAVQSYGPSVEAAMELNEAAKEAMEDLPTLSSVVRCRLNSDYNFTDTSTRRHRYQAVFDITYY